MFFVFAQKNNLFGKVAVLLLVVAGFAFGTTSGVSAAFNEEINYQAKLADDTGATVPDGDYSITYKLYTVPTGGGAVFTETATSTVTSGLFSYLIGSSTALSAVDFDQTLYLGVEINGDGEMTPRKRMGAVPSAFEAGNAQTLGDIATTSFLRSDQDDTASGLLTFTGGIISNSSSTISEFNFSTATGTTLVINGESFTDFTGSGLINTAGVLTTNISESNLNIADAPVDGYVLQASSTATGGFVWQATSSLGFAASGDLSGYLPLTGGTLSGQLDFSGSSANIALGDNYLSGDGGDEGIFVDGDGKVGINNGAPAELLEVDGGSANTYIQLSSAGNRARGIIFSRDGTNNEASLEVDSLEDLYLTNSRSGETLQLQTNDGSGATTRIFVDSDGEVGIGNTNPSAVLHVTGSTRVDSGGIGINMAPTNGGTMAVRRNGFNPYIDFYQNDNAIGQLRADGGDGYMAITDGSGTRMLTVMTVGTTTGNIGIGTTTPTSRFAVGATSTQQFLVSDLGVITDGVWQGSEITDTYLSDTLTISSGGSVDEAAINVGTEGYVLQTTGGSATWVATTSLGFASASSSHDALTLAGQNYLTLSGQEITAGEIEPDDLANSDFGDFSCNGTTCSLDADTVAAAEMANSDHGFFTYASGVATLDTGGLTSANLADALTNETGTGFVVFSDSPAFTTTLSTPAITTASGALTVTPAAGSNFDLNLSTTGDFAVNTNDLYVDTSTGFVGIGKTPSGYALDARGDARVGSLNINNEINGTSVGTLLTVDPGGLSNPGIFGNTDLAVFGYSGSTNGNTTYTGDIMKIETTVQGSILTGQSPVTYDNSLLYIKRNVTTSFATGNSSIVTGPLAEFIDTCEVGIGDSCSSSADVLRLGQAAASSTGSVLNITSSTTKDSLLVRVNDDGTYTDTSAFVIDQDGNVGIGTTTPSSKLTVAGDAYITGALYDSTNSAGTNGYVLQTTGSGFEWVATSSLGFGTGNGSVTSVDASVPTGWTITNNPITTSGTLAFAYDTGYAAVLTASTTAWNNFLNTPSTVITDGTGLTWTGNTLAADLGTDITAAEMANSDHGFFTYSSGVASLDTDGLTSANLADALTNETGTGSVVFSASPTFTGTAIFANTGIQVGSSVPFSDAAGTLTLQNVDALDATTETTIEGAIDTAANLTSIQGRTVTLADAGADAFFGWDDTASTYENLTASEALTIIGGTANDFDANGDVTITEADISDFAISTGDITDGTITEADLNLNAATTGYVLQASGSGSGFAWVATSTLGITSGSAITFGTDNQIPFTNAGATDFDYSGNFTYNGSTLSVQTTATDDILNLFETGGTEVFSVLENGNVGIGTSSPSNLLTVQQAADSDGLRIAGFDNEANEGLDVYVDSAGITILDVYGPSGTAYLSSGGQVIAAITGSALIMPDDREIEFGNDSDYSIGYDNSDDTFRITDGTDLTIDANTRLLMNASGNVGIGTTTPTGLLSMQTAFGNGDVDNGGIDQLITTTNSTNGAVQIGNEYYFDASGATATTTVVGGIVRVQDDTTFGNTVRGFEVQAYRGNNTQGENTALSGFARTFGVRGKTEGDAGGLYEPAGGFFETAGTAQGNAIRGYSSSITTTELLSLFQEDSAFAGTGLLMNFGNDTGSFASTTSKFVDFQNAGTSKFTVSAHGTTTIGDGTTNNMASLHIGYGGLCVDNDGSCTAASTTLGRISSVSQYTGNSDLAEMYFSSDDLVPGEIVVADGFLSVSRATAETDKRVLGVISTKPGLLIGADDTSLIEGQQGFPLALTGRVPIRLSDENGDVAVGDALTLSSIPGIAMKAGEADQIVGYALEAYDGTYAYTEGYINQFGDDIAEPNYDAININTKAATKADCYFGGGVATGEEAEECDASAAPETEDQEETDEEAEAAARYAAEQIALQALREEPTEAMQVNGETVYVGSVTMFVDRGYNFTDTHISVLEELTSTSTDLVLGADDDSDETLWSRLKELAQNFVAGVLTVTGIETERVQTDELCVDDVCITANDLRTLLEGGTEVGVSEAEDDESDDSQDDQSDTQDDAEIEDETSTEDESPLDANASSTATTTDPIATDDSTSTSAESTQEDDTDQDTDDTASSTTEVTDENTEEDAPEVEEEVLTEVEEEVVVEETEPEVVTETEEDEVVEVEPDTEADSSDETAEAESDTE